MKSFTHLFYDTKVINICEGGADVDGRSILCIIWPKIQSPGWSGHRSLPVDVKGLAYESRGGYVGGDSHLCCTDIPPSDA